MVPGSAQISMVCLQPIQASTAATFKNGTGRIYATSTLERLKVLSYFSHSFNNIFSDTRTGAFVVLDLDDGK